MGSHSLIATGPPSSYFVTISPVTTPITVTVGSWVNDFAMTISLLSTIGSLLIILTYSLFRETRTTSREILVYLSLADIGGNVMMIWGVKDNDINNSNSVGCQVQSVILIYSGIAEYLWTCALSVYLYVIIVHNSHWGSRSCPAILHVVCWGAGFVVALVAFLENKTGIDAQASNTAQWCIIRGAADEEMDGNRNYVLWSMLVGDGWNMLAMLCTLILYVLIKRHIYFETHSNQTSLLTRRTLSAVQQVDRKLTFIPLAYFLLHIWSVVRSLIALSSSDKETTLSVRDNILIGLQTFGDSSEGLVNSIIFLFLSPKVRNLLFDAIVRSTCRCCRNCLRRREYQALQRSVQESLSVSASGNVSSSSSPSHTKQYHLRMGHASRGSPVPALTESVNAECVDSEHPEPVVRRGHLKETTERTPLLQEKQNYTV